LVKTIQRTKNCFKLGIWPQVLFTALWKQLEMTNQYKIQLNLNIIISVIPTRNTIRQAHVTV